MTYAVDVYDDEVLVWSLAGDGASVKRVTGYTPTLYVAAAGGDLGTVREHTGAVPGVAATRVEQHRTGFREEPRPVLQADVGAVDAVRSVTRTVAGWGGHPATTGCSTSTSLGGFVTAWRGASSPSRRSDRSGRSGWRPTSPPSPGRR